MLFCGLEWLEYYRPCMMYLVYLKKIYKIVLNLSASFIVNKDNGY